jgi:hypothetical protein
VESPSSVMALMLNSSTMGPVCASSAVVSLFGSLGGGSFSSSLVAMVVLVGGVLGGGSSASSSSSLVVSWLASLLLPQLVVAGMAYLTSLRSPRSPHSLLGQG